MENKEEILQALEEFTRKPTEKIPSILEDYLRNVATTGETTFPWCKVKAIFIAKLDQAMVQFNADVPVVDVTPVPNVENIHFDMHRKRVLKSIHAFSAAPFTIQRLCELITNPRKHYRITDKFMRGLEKNVQVVSSVDPFGNKIVCESKTLVNGMDANGYEGNGQHGEETPLFNSPFPPPPVPPSSAQASPTGGLPWQQDNFTASPVSTWPSAGIRSPCREIESEAPVTPGTNIRAAIEECKAAERRRAASRHDDDDDDDSKDEDLEPAAKKLRIDSSSSDEEAREETVTSSEEKVIENEDNSSGSSCSLKSEEDEDAPEEVSESLSERTEEEITNSEEETQHAESDEVKPSDIVKRHDSGGFDLSEPAESEEDSGSPPDNAPSVESSDVVQADEAEEKVQDSKVCEAESTEDKMAAGDASPSTSSSDSVPESDSIKPITDSAEGSGDHTTTEPAAGSGNAAEQKHSPDSASPSPKQTAPESGEQRTTPDSSDAENSQESATSSSSAEEVMDTE